MVIRLIDRRVVQLIRVIALTCPTREGPPRWALEVATAVALTRDSLRGRTRLLSDPPQRGWQRSSVLRRPWRRCRPHSWYRMAASTASRHVAGAGAGSGERRAGIDDTSHGYCVGARRTTEQAMSMPVRRRRWRPPGSICRGSIVSTACQTTWTSWCTDSPVTPPCARRSLLACLPGALRIAPRSRDASRTRRPW